MEYLTDDCKNDESFVSLADVFETWINGRTNQNTEQLEKEEFTAGLIIKRSETLLNEDSRRRSFDRIRQMKLYELGQERVKKFRISRNHVQPQDHAACTNMQLGVFSCTITIFWKPQRNKSLQVALIKVLVLTIQILIMMNHCPKFRDFLTSLHFTLPLTNLVSLK